MIGEFDITLVCKAVRARWDRSVLKVSRFISGAFMVDIWIDRRMFVLAWTPRYPDIIGVDVIGDDDESSELTSVMRHAARSIAEAMEIIEALHRADRSTR